MIYVEMLLLITYYIANLKRLENGATNLWKSLEK